MMPPPQRTTVRLDPAEALQPASPPVLSRRFRVFAERVVNNGLMFGFGVTWRDGYDLQLAVGPWVIGIEYTDLDYEQ